MTEEQDRLIAKLETAHGQNMREIDRLNAELAAEKQYRQGHIRLVETLEQEHDALRAELAAANDMKRRITDACEEVNRVAEQYRADIAAERGYRAETERQLQTWIAEAAKDIDVIKELRTELAAEERRIAVMAKEIAELRSRPDALRADKAEAERDNLRAELAAANTRADRADEMNGHRAREMLRLSSELAARDELLREARKRLDVLPSATEFCARIDALGKGGEGE